MSTTCGLNQSDADSALYTWFLSPLKIDAMMSRLVDMQVDRPPTVEGFQLCR
jgi:hypothetical protein